MLSRWKPQRAVRGWRHVRKAVGSPERNQLASPAKDVQSFDKLSAERHADSTPPSCPLTSPIYGWVARFKNDPAALLEMSAHVAQDRRRISIGKQDLENMPSHDDQVEAPM